MQTQWRRLALYAAIALTVVMTLFPPFTINGGPDEYGFLLSGPPSVRQYLNQMSELGGTQGREIAGGFIHYSLDVVRLLLQLLAVWGVFFALRRTVLRAQPA